jgi:predicted ABC-type ATPase
MATIHIIAGPPGIGKSTLGHQFVPPGIEILKKDEMIATNKTFGFKIFQEIAIQNWLSAINRNISNNQDFAIELPMGVPTHYDFILKAKQTNPENKLNIVLLHTDDLAMCRERAAKRFEQGGHEVNPQVLENMYHNTIPLLKANFPEIDHLTLVNINPGKKPQMAGIYDKNALSFDSYTKEALWYREKLKPFIEDQVTMPSYLFSR